METSPPHGIQGCLSSAVGGRPTLRLTSLKTGVTPSRDARPYSTATLPSRHVSDSLLGAVGLSGTSSSPQPPLHVSLLTSTSLHSIVALQLWILREQTYSVWQGSRSCYRHQRRKSETRSSQKRCLHSWNTVCLNRSSVRFTSPLTWQSPIVLEL